MKDISPYLLNGLCIIIITLILSPIILAYPIYSFVICELY
jgi:hypothetical protein